MSRPSYDKRVKLGFTASKHWNTTVREQKIGVDGYWSTSLGK